MSHILLKPSAMFESFPDVASEEIDTGKIDYDVDFLKNIFNYQFKEGRNTAACGVPLALT